MVGYVERWIGRIAAVLIVVAMLFSIVGGAGWLLTRQLIDLAAKLPDYQTNIDANLRSRARSSTIMKAGITNSQCLL